MADRKNELLAIAAKLEHIASLVEENALCSDQAGCLDAGCDRLLKLSDQLDGEVNLLLTEEGEATALNLGGSK